MIDNIVRFYFYGEWILGSYREVSRGGVIRRTRGYYWGFVGSCRAALRGVLWLCGVVLIGDSC